MAIQNVLDLDQFCNVSENLYDWTGLKFTDGIKYLADNADAQWLISTVSAYLVEPEVKTHSFLIVRLTVNPDKSALFEMWTDDEPDGKRVASQRFGFTDFPLDRIELYLCSGVLMLKSEY